MHRKKGSLIEQQERKAASVVGAYRKATFREGSLPISKARLIVANPPTCPYCKHVIPWHALSWDHIIPISRGGSGQPNNLVLVDLECNMIKGNLTGEEFQLLLDFLLPHPLLFKLVSQRLKRGGIFRRRSYGRKKGKAQGR